MLPIEPQHVTDKKQLRRRLRRTHSLYHLFFFSLFLIWVYPPRLVCSAAGPRLMLSFKGVWVCVLLS